MARVARMALDVAIVSLRTVTPAISRVWTATKRSSGDPDAVPPLVKKIENTLGSFSDLLINRLRSLRDQLLPIEEQYLLRQLEIVRRKMSNRGVAGKTIKSEVAIAWQYWKVEVVPPMTTSFFAGPAGTQMENACGKFADSMIGTMEKSVQAMDAAEAKAKQAKLDAIKAAEAQAKAKAHEEAKKRAAEEKKAADDKKAAQAKKEETKAKEKPPPPKDEKKAKAEPTPKKEPPNKK